MLRIACGIAVIVACVAQEAAAAPPPPEPPIPNPGCGFIAWDPVLNAPATPAPAGVPCSADQYFSIYCGSPPTGCPGVSTTILHDPPVLLTRRSEVVDGDCVQVDESFDVNCGEVIRLHVRPPACPRRPASACSVGGTPDGIRVFCAEDFALSILDTDPCGNLVECRVDPLATPDPADPERMQLCPPRAKKCPGGACVLPSLFAPSDHAAVATAGATATIQAQGAPGPGLR